MLVRKVDHKHGTQEFLSLDFLVLIKNRWVWNAHWVNVQVVITQVFLCVGHILSACKIDHSLKFFVKLLQFFVEVVHNFCGNWFCGVNNEILLSLIVRFSINIKNLPSPKSTCSKRLHSLSSKLTTATHNQNAFGSQHSYIFFIYNWLIIIQLI